MGIIGRENYGRKEWEGMRRMGIIGGKTMAGRVVGYEKDGNYRRENYGRKEW